MRTVGCYREEDKKLRKQTTPLGLKLPLQRCKNIHVAIAIDHRTSLQEFHNRSTVIEEQYHYRHLSCTGQLFVILGVAVTVHVPIACSCHGSY